MKALCFGGTYIDYIYSVDHFVQPAESLFCKERIIVAGGKAANCAVAIAKAGAEVILAGKVGRDGEAYIADMQAHGVNTEPMLVSDKFASGHTIIQVNPKGENSIIVFPEANVQVSKEEITAIFDAHGHDCIVTVENSINNVPFIIEQAKKRKLPIYFNPSPFSDDIFNYPLHDVSLFIVNEVEAARLVGNADNETMLKKLGAQYPQAEIILTLGDAGVHYQFQQQHYYIAAEKITPIDPTAAGDTFFGYFTAMRLLGKSTEAALTTANKAAAICVTRKGAMDAVPAISECD